MDKYKAFRNFMFNDLKITKEDIRQWAKEACLEAALNRVKSTDVEGIVSREVEKQVKQILMPSSGNPSKKIMDSLKVALKEVVDTKLKVSVT